MPKRTDIHTVLIIGSGPIVIGQACEFDYSGAQACKALREEGYRVVLVNSNPATIMTDPEFADRTYIEPITTDAIVRILTIEAESGQPVDALLPTLGGQTALNMACQLYDQGVLDQFGVEMIGADRTVIHRAEDREAFRNVIESLGLKQPMARTVESLDEAHEFLDASGLPVIIRPAFTLGGTGGGVAHTLDEFDEIVRRGLDASMIRQVLLDEKANAEAALPLVEKDMRLDCYYGMDHTFSNAADMIRTKLELLDIESEAILPEIARRAGL